MTDHDASDVDELDRRLRAVERALTDDADLTDLGDAAELAREVDSLADRLDAVEGRLDELDAATQALRGYVGNVREVNDAVERRADAAVAAVERLEADLDAADSAAVTDTGPERTPRTERTTPDGDFTERDDTDHDDERAGVLARVRRALTGPR